MNLSLDVCQGKRNWEVAMLLMHTAVPGIIAPVSALIAKRGETGATACLDLEHREASGILFDENIHTTESMRRQGY